MKQIFALALAWIGLAGCHPRDADRSELLWPQGAPRARGNKPGDRPRLYWFVPPPERRNGTVVVVAGGGSYGHHAGIRHEAVMTARWLEARGITAVVVRYRVGWAGHYNYVDFIADGKRAVRTVRARADELQIDPERIGMIGYSAGGHLASVVATQCGEDEGDSQAADPVDRESCRIAFSVLVYPVITLDDRYAHRRSRNNLLNGIDAPSRELIEQLSMENQVTSKTAPGFVVHSREDARVDWHNSELYYEALVEHGVPAQLLLFDDGRHGVGLADDPRHMPQMSTWPDRMYAWLQERKLVPEGHASAQGSSASP